MAWSMLMESQANKQQTESIMSTYTNNLLMENGLMGAMGLAGMFAGTGYTSDVAKAKLGRRARNVALFFAATCTGLAYLLAFPFVGIAMLAWIGAKAVMKNEKARPVALVIAAPLIGRAFVTVGPIVGVVALAWFGGRAVLKAK